MSVLPSYLHVKGNLPNHGVDSTFLLLWILLALCFRPYSYFHISHQSSEALSTMNPQWPHLTGTQVGESHYPFCLSLLFSIPRLSSVTTCLQEPAPISTSFTGDSKSLFRSRVWLALLSLSLLIFLCLTVIYLQDHLFLLPSISPRNTLLGVYSVLLALS